MNKVFLLFCWGLVAVLFFAGLSASTVAVDFIEIVEKQAVAEQNQNRNGFRIENFDQWVFRSQETLAGAKQKLLERLESEADSLQLICGLDEAQKKKLLLAGRGDIQAFVEAYTKVRAKFAESLKEQGQQAVQNIWQEIQPLQRKYHGMLFGEGSLFEKVLEHLLDEQQSARRRAVLREQRKFRLRSAEMQLISQMDRVSPFTQEKREKLLALVEQYVRPPKSFSKAEHSHYVMYYLLGQMAKIPEDELRPLFDEAAWTVVQQQIKQGKRMRGNLKAHGLVPEEE